MEDSEKGDKILAKYSKHDDVDDALINMNEKIATLEAELEWIPVTERLPETNAGYLVTDNVTAWISHFSIYPGIFSHEKFSISHWKPIILPKENKE